MKKTKKKKTERGSKQADEFEGEAGQYGKLNLNGKLHFM